MPRQPAAPKKPRKKKPTPPPPLPPGPAPPPSPNGAAGHGQGGAAGGMQPGLDVLWADRVVREPLAWLVPGLIPRYRLTPIVGDQGAGKSLLLARVAAQVTAGSRILLDSEPQPPGRVLCYAPEDDHRGEMHGRLAAAGCDMSKVAFGDWRSDQSAGRPPHLPDQLVELDGLVGRLRVSLLLYDPLPSYLSPGVSEIDRQQVRCVMEGLQAMGRRRGCTILCTLQLRKSRQGSPLDWVAGCREWTAVPRHVLTLGRDPRDEERRVVVLTKCLEGQRGTARLYSAPETDGYPVWTIGGDAHVAAADMAGVPSSDTDRDARGEARQYLRELLDTTEVRQVEIMDKARRLGISDRTLRRAKVDLSVSSAHRGEAGDRHLVWVRPEIWPDLG